jgi:peptidoglycan LD-endopeptidase CwlK
MTCHLDIQKIINDLDDEILVLEGKRTIHRQTELFKAGLSKTMNSKHLVDDKNPLSRAIDIAPAPLNWDDLEAFVSLSKKVLALAKKHNVKMRWGGDWNMNGDWRDEKFRDMVHFELL